MVQEIGDSRHILGTGVGDVTASGIFAGDELKTIVFRKQNDPNDKDDFETEAYSVVEIDNIAARAKDLDLFDQVAKLFVGRVEVPGARELFELDKLEQISMFNQKNPNSFQPEP